jgi:putative membrane protein
VVRFFATAVLALIGNALGLIVAAVLLDDFSLSVGAFIIDVAVFTLAFVVLRPLIIKMTLSHSTALAGGSALIATLVALIIADIVSGGLSISGVLTWVLATVIIWIVAMLAGVLLPLVMFKQALGRAAGQRPAASRTWG